MIQHFVDKCLFRYSPGYFILIPSWSYFELFPKLVELISLWIFRYCFRKSFNFSSSTFRNSNSSSSKKTLGMIFKIHQRNKSVVASRFPVKIQPTIFKKNSKNAPKNLFPYFQSLPIMPITPEMHIPDNWVSDNHNLLSQLGNIKRQYVETFGKKTCKKYMPQNNKRDNVCVVRLNA